MPRKSATDHVRKICGCTQWKTCAHPWYLDFQRKHVRYRGNLDRLIDRHAPDFTAAVDEARRAIVAKLEGRDPKGLIPEDDPTLTQVLTDYLIERPRLDRWQPQRILRTVVGGLPFGTWRLGAITTDVIRQFHRLRPRVQGNRDLGLLRAAFNWAIVHGLLKASPFRIENVPIIRMKREPARSRRLQPREGERLLLAARGLRDLIVAALETGMRQGELLSLQWHQVRFTPRAELFLPAPKTKGRRDRRVPISSVLRSVLDRRRLDPAGDEHPPEAYVFGDEVGRRRYEFPKKAWSLTRRRARVEDLHFHDLRREAGSRWMDAGVPLATIQRWLGHHNISQTSTYLGASLGGDEQDMSAYEARIGRLTQIDVSSGSNGSDRPPSDQRVIEKTQLNAVGHEAAAIPHRHVSSGHRVKTQG
jgi:integrase